MAKLFGIVGPDMAYFGQKDAQQALLIRRMVRDLAMSLRVEVCPTVREDDGLALSSRNVHLTAADRTRAAALHRSLDAARQAVATGERDAAEVRASALAELAGAGIETEYFELVGPEDLAPIRRIKGEALAVVAARVGETRLIDNALIQPLATASSGGDENGRRSLTDSAVTENLA